MDKHVMEICNMLPVCQAVLHTRCRNGGCLGAQRPCIGPGTVRLMFTSEWPWSAMTRNLSELEAPGASLVRKVCSLPMPFFCRHKHGTGSDRAIGAANCMQSISQLQYWGTESFLAHWDREDFAWDPKAKAVCSIIQSRPQHAYQVAIDVIVPRAGLQICQLHIVQGTCTASPSSLY